MAADEDVNMTVQAAVTAPKRLGADGVLVPVTTLRSFKWDWPDWLRRNADGASNTSDLFDCSGTIVIGLRLFHLSLYAKGLHPGSTEDYNLVNELFGNLWLKQYAIGGPDLAYPMGITRVYLKAKKACPGCAVKNDLVQCSCVWVVDNSGQLFVDLWHASSPENLTEPRFDDMTACAIHNAFLEHRSILSHGFGQLPHPSGTEIPVKTAHDFVVFPHCKTPRFDKMYLAVFPFSDDGKTPREVMAKAFGMPSCGLTPRFGQVPPKAAAAVRSKVAMKFPKRAKKEVAPQTAGDMDLDDEKAAYAAAVTATAAPAVVYATRPPAKIKAPRLKAPPVVAATVEVATAVAQVHQDQPQHDGDGHTDVFEVPYGLGELPQLSARHAKIDMTAPVTLPAPIKMEFQHPFFGDLVVVAELVYVSVEQPDGVKMRAAGFERYHMPRDPTRDKVTRVAKTRVLYLHRILAVYSPHTPNSCFVGQWFSSLNVSSEALGNGEPGFKAWTLLHSANNYTLHQATSHNGFKNNISLATTPFRFPPIELGPHAPVKGANHDNITRCRLCRKPAPQSGLFPAHEKCPINDEKACFRRTSRLQEQYMEKQHQKMPDGIQDMLHPFFKTPIVVGTTLPATVCIQPDELHQYETVYERINNTANYHVRTIAGQAPKFLPGETAKLLPDVYYERTRTDHYWLRELRKTLGDDMLLPDLMGLYCVFECNEFECNAPDEVVGAFECVHGIMHEPYAEPSKREDKNGPMYYVPRWAALHDPEDEALAVELAACGIDGGKAGDDGGGADIGKGKGKSRAGGGGEDAGAKKKRAAPARQKKARKSQRQYEDHVPTPWDARIQFQTLRNVTWRDARHIQLRKCFDQLMSNLRVNGVMSFSLDHMRASFFLNKREHLSQLLHYYNVAPAQPYAFYDRPWVHIVFDLKDPKMMLPKRYNSMTTTVFLVDQALFGPGHTLCANSPAPRTPISNITVTEPDEAMISEDEAEPVVVSL